MVFYKGMPSANPEGRGKFKYPMLENPWNTRYSRMKAQAKFRMQEFNLTPQEYMKLWDDSGVKEHCGSKPHQYCMVRKDPIEAWSYNNCIIVPRRMHLKKQVYEACHNYPETNWQDKHGVKLTTEDVYKEWEKDHE